MKLLPLAALALTLCTAHALELEGVNVPEQTTVAGKPLKLNGAGVRTVTLAFIPIKAYVAAFYAPSKVGSEGAVEKSPGPLKFTFTFLQGVNQGQVTQAWNAQFKASASHDYPGLAKDQEQFVKFFGPLSKMGVESVELVGDDTLVYDDGTLKGTVKGKDFQKAFLSMWFGSRPVMTSLKSSLLGK
jgi:hypothetical protein